MVCVNTTDPLQVLQLKPSQASHVTRQQQRAPAGPVRTDNGARLWLPITHLGLVDVLYSSMPPRKRKQGAAEQQQAQPADDAGDQQQPDRDEVARKVQEKLKALDSAGRVSTGRSARPPVGNPIQACFPSPASLAVEARCQAIAEAAQEIVDNFMQEFKIRLMTGMPKQVRRRRRCARRAQRAQHAS